MSAIFSWGIHIWNFKTVAFTVLKLCYASKSVTNGRTDGRTDGRTNNPEAICPSNFFEVGGIINGILQSKLHMESHFNNKSDYTACNKWNLAKSNSQTTETLKVTFTINLITQRVINGILQSQIHKQQNLACHFNNKSDYTACNKWNLAKSNSQTTEPWKVTFTINLITQRVINGILQSQIHKQQNLRKSLQQ